MISLEELLGSFAYVKINSFISFYKATLLLGHVLCITELQVFQSALWAFRSQFEYSFKIRSDPLDLRKSWLSFDYCISQKAFGGPHLHDTMVYKSPAPVVCDPRQPSNQSRRQWKGNLDKTLGMWSSEYRQKGRKICVSTSDRIHTGVTSLPVQGCQGLVFYYYPMSVSEDTNVSDSKMWV